jgi:hypothetical protein
MTPVWAPLRVTVAALRAAALVAGGAGTYLSLSHSGETSARELGRS